MIVDKKNDLNIYKEDTRKVEKDKEVSASCCSSDDTKTAPQAACCGSTQASGEVKMPEAITGGCCGSSSLAKKKEVRNIVDINFNEWVGEQMIRPSYEDQRIADLKSPGSFSVYAVKPC